MAKYIYQHENWTNFVWDDENIRNLFGEVKYLQGKLKGIMSTIGLLQKGETLLNTFTFDILKSSEIEGEILNYDQVRSSIARRLGLNVAGLVPSARNIEGLVEMMLDATRQYNKELTEERLFGWHNALFPSGYSGVHKIDVARYRKDEMQVVSGAMGKEQIHFEAVPQAQIQQEMDKFLDWLNTDTRTDNILKAAIAHFWFITIHPFDDGNGRMARTISDMLLARAENSPQRFYSLSSQILAAKNQYYAVLQKTQWRSNSDITEWLRFFLNCMKNALLTSEQATASILYKAKFWAKHENTEINERQRLMLNRLLDGDFVGKLQSSKWAKICKCSQDTAIRDIKGLIEKGILQQEKGGGRNTNYELANL
ncbi:MAG: Fic family protein [Prevotellaceae bacterium]|jgi:Fic family protein|nr:Fic family protein [Prevotellaceae bacterium]